MCIRRRPHVLQETTAHVRRHDQVKTAQPEPAVGIHKRSGMLCYTSHGTRSTPHTPDQLPSRAPGQPSSRPAQQNMHSQRARRLEEEPRVLVRRHVARTRR